MTFKSLEYYRFNKGNAIVYSSSKFFLSIYYAYIGICIGVVIYTINNLIIIGNQGFDAYVDKLIPKEIEINNSENETQTIPNSIRQEYNEDKSKFKQLFLVLNQILQIFVILIPTLIMKNITTSGFIISHFCYFLISCFLLQKYFFIVHLIQLILWLVIAEILVRYYSCEVGYVEESEDGLIVTIDRNLVGKFNTEKHKFFISHKKVVSESTIFEVRYRNLLK